MKHVNHLEIIAQPAFVEGLFVSCPHCNQAARVREDGSIYCASSNRSYAPESTDGELFDMRRSFDAQKGIKQHHRHHMVPMLLATSGYDPSDAGRGFHPSMSGALERLASGHLFMGSMNRVFA